MNNYINKVLKMKIIFYKFVFLFKQYVNSLTNDINNTNDTNNKCNSPC